MTALVSEDTQAATAAAAALQDVIGDAATLTVGTPQVGLFDADALIPEAGASVTAVALAGVPGGHIAIAVSARLAELIAEAGQESDAVVAEAIRASLPALETVAGVALEAGDPEPVAIDALTGAECSVVQFLEGEVCVATFIVRNPSDEAGIAPHEFQPLEAGFAGSLAGSRALDLLRDVELGVTAELGRRRMVVRDLLALAPGTVIELDRAAGSPIDVLVNGTLIARGEVVVIDEEFGIRITEIVGKVDEAQ
ncbi:MAG: flagellar motor switch protein FliN [Acidimicrobiia bacterium]